MAGAQGTATVDFGTGALEATVVVTGQATITTANLVEAWPLLGATDDTPWVELMQVYAGKIVNGTGFTIIAKPTIGQAVGQHSIGWVWN